MTKNINRIILSLALCSFIACKKYVKHQHLDEETIEHSHYHIEDNVHDLDITTNNEPKDYLADGKYFRGHVYMTATSYHRKGIFRIHTRNITDDDYDDHGIACLYDFADSKFLFVGQTVYAKVYNLNGFTVAEDIKLVNETLDTVAFSDFDRDLIVSFSMELHGTLGSHDIILDGGTRHTIWHIENKVGASPGDDSFKIDKFFTQNITLDSGREYRGIIMQTKVEPPKAPRTDTIYFDITKVPSETELLEGFYINRVFKKAKTGEQIKVVTIYSKDKRIIHTFDEGRH